MFNDNFYPTPIDIAVKMRSFLSCKSGAFVLEPSAGKGDLAEVLSKYFTVECIEIETQLQDILKGRGFSVVGSDFLTYSGPCYYDAIVMNPPFDDGAKHLLKAWEYLNSGEIVCLLNKETIDNPYTEERKKIQKLISLYGKVEYLGQCFKSAERKTNVDVVLVYLKKEITDNEGFVEIENHSLEEAISLDDDITSTEVALIDNIANLVSRYKKIIDLRLKAEKLSITAEYHRQIAGFSEYCKEEKEVYSLKQFNSLLKARYAEIIKGERSAAWNYVFFKTKLSQYLDSAQKNEFNKKIEQDSFLDFTEENIKDILGKLFYNQRAMALRVCANAFKLICSYAEDVSFDVKGWKTNSKYKVNKKVIIPNTVDFEKYSRYGKFSLNYGRRGMFDDIERALCVICKIDFTKLYHLSEIISEFCQKDIYSDDKDFSGTSRFFDWKIFKKGTIHLIWKDENILHEFNKAATRGFSDLGDARGSAEWNKYNRKNNSESDNPLILLS